MNTTITEICCGSYYDAMQAVKGGAERIELNTALALGGLTPTTATLRLIKEQAPFLQVIAMVRPRGAGFCYTEDEFIVMEAECEQLLQNGADGIAFGCLNADTSLDLEKNKRLLERIKAAGKEAVFHRAFDCTKDPFAAMEQLIAMRFDRVLTSGLQPTAIAGAQMLARLQASYGTQIQLLAGSGVNAQNGAELIRRTGIRQIHSSCKDWIKDPTTVCNGVSYSMTTGMHESMYDVVSAQKVRELIAATMDIG